MTRFFASVTAAALGLAAAVSAAQAVPAFELVSVRRSPPVSAGPGPPGTRTGLVVLPGGRFEARGQSLATLARVAFAFDHVDPNRGVVQADADWMWNDRFDITAAADHRWTSPPPGTTVPAELRTMLRALLEDRFALKTRIETKNVGVTALVLAKPDALGPGLRPSAAACRGPFTDASPDETTPTPRCPFTSTRERIQAQAVTMAEAAQLLAQLPLPGPLVDQTRLPGLYDISLSVPKQTGTEMVAVRELEAQLGLKLKQARASIPTLIIERAKKPQED